MPNGFGRGFGFGRGMGFGFRGSSPPWPYIGRGRGGLPRCGYFFAGAAAPPAWPYPPIPYAHQMNREQELSFLKQQAEAMRVELKEIEGRIQELAK